MTTDEDIDALAGDYVLGALDSSERAAVATRRSREPELDAAIHAWEARLAPLNETTPPVEPPPDLLTRIEARLDAEAAVEAGRDAGAVVELAALRRKLRRWRRIAVGAMAAAASLLGVLIAREALFLEPPQRFIGVFAQGDVLPSFYLTLDLDARTLTLRPVGAERQPGKTYQLWIASDRLGPAPQSLGLVDDELKPTIKVLASYDTGLLRQATFGVSLEPAGGSPTGRPTSPALHAKLLPVAN